jgi:hypothetical protein
MADPSYTIAEFCAAERLSRSMLYKLWHQGKGPRWFNVATHRRISHQARTEWRQQREAEASDGGANGRHFSAGHGDLSQCIEQSYEGMAHFAGTGPKGETCGGCRHFRRGRGKNRACGKFAELTGVGSKKIPPDAAACKYFERSS